MTKNLPEEAKAKWIESIPLKRAGTTDDVAIPPCFLHLIFHPL